MVYHSQIGQDQWVESILGTKRDGFFVELGACDGLYLSNTLFFERERGWKGICIEPHDYYFQQLAQNRSCHTVNELAYSNAGEVVPFAMCNELSGVIDKYLGPFTNKQYSVDKLTTTLGSILDRCHAPYVIDYLSLDVEGQEYNILSTFPFDKYQFRCITVEHNAPHVGPTQQKLIREILEKNGYQYVKGNDDVEKWGHGPIDDFYVYPSLLSSD
jgi:FkbM family methyltransferase